MLDLSHLNPAQYEAVTAPEGPLLVIAGAGSGKTRTIVYRLAWLIDQGHSPDSMLLLTFTRKAAQEMLDRASRILGWQLTGLQGGTFHGFAYSVLRRFPPSWATGSLSVMDASESAAALKQCKDELGIAKGDRSFPRSQAVIGLLSKARNKETDIDSLLHREAQHLLPHAEDIIRLGEAYAHYRRTHALLDYDDLLFHLEAMLRENPDVLEMQRLRFRHILVDEYQDTNRVQARLVQLLAGDGPDGGNVMAVGDDAQSIYAFRGATVHNILDFPKLFPGARLVRLEENYRSIQPILDIANALLENAPAAYQKHLFSRRPVPEDTAVRLYRPLSDLTQGNLAAARIEELLESYPPSEIAVLFRAGYQSYHLEVELNKRGIAFRKYGGLRYAEAAHVKDVLAYARLVANPLDLPSFERLAGLTKGIGPKTARKFHTLAAEGTIEKLLKSAARFPSFLDDLALIDTMRTPGLSPQTVISTIMDHYRPRMEIQYPDDWPRRLQGLEELLTIAAGYDDLSLFIADLSLDSPEDEAQEDRFNRVTLSTVHSAKGLEWSAVLVIDLVEERFPSRHAMVRPDDFEEERRLMYVACTRARDSLDLFVPLNLYRRSSGGQEPATPSPFVRELPLDDLEEIYERYGSLLRRPRVDSSFSSETRCQEPLDDGMDDNPFDMGNDDADTPSTALVVAPAVKQPFSLAERDVAPETHDTASGHLGYCRHRLFGRGKIVEALPPDKYRVNFPGLGLKVILAAYLSLE